MFVVYQIEKIYGWDEIAEVKVKLLMAFKTQSEAARVTRLFEKNKKESNYSYGYGKVNNPWE